MNKYENYKKVEIPWVRKIPTHWRIERNKNIFIKIKSVVGIQNKTTDLLSLTTKGIKVKSKDQIGGKQPSSYEGYQFVNKDNLVLCLFDLDCSAVFSDVSQYNGMISPAYDVFKVEKQIPQYYKYLFSYLFQDRVYKIYSKSVRYTITEENFNTLLTIVPPLEEQKQIANYLDWKIGEIDKLIELEKQKIEELKVLRQQFIDKIIKSLDYEYIPFKAIFDLGKGLSITKENLGSTGVKCINYGDIHGDFKFSFYSYDNRLKKLEKTTGVTISAYANLKCGNFIFADTSEDIDGCGNFTYLEDNIEKVYAGYHTIVGKLKLRLNCRYLAYYFESEKWRKQIRQKVKGVKVFSITQAILKSTKIQLPNDRIQNKIVHTLDNYMNKNNKLSNCIDEKINNLIKIKQSLISEVVTGQIDVRNVKIPERK